MKTILVFMLCFSSAAFAKPEVATPYCASLNKIVGQGTAVQRLQKYFAAAWKYKMTEFPEYATYAGYPGQNDRWTDYSFTAIERRRQEKACALKALLKIPDKGLKGEDHLSFELARRELEMSIEADKFGNEFLILNHLDGLHMEAADLLEDMPTVTTKDYENILARLEKLPVVEAQSEALLREGIKRHITAVKMFLSRVPAQFDKVLAAKVEDSPLYKPFVNIKANIDTAAKTALQERARQVIRNQAFPALQKLKDFVVTEYIPGATENISMSEMPNGKEWYAFLVKKHTTTNMTPDQLHDLGLREVERIHKEMEGIRQEVKFAGDLKEFNAFLLKDRRFYYTDKEQLLAGYRDIAKRIDPELPKLFKTLPELPYGVREMPAYKAAEAPGAYYMGGSLEAGRAGYFTANTSDLSGRPKWGMEALTLHEAVPGHHLQIALAQELKNLPEFRRHSHYTAFIEGWGLYAESLGPELGLFKDPYSRYGQLSYEMWRAIRLVTDTGIHAKGWTRQQALDYFAANMPKAEKETEVEVDRYITWPGQALAYKVGQLKFRELRERAQTELGENFNVREFHDQLLKHGGLPMDVLEKTVNEWIAAKKKNPEQKKLKDRV